MCLRFPATSGCGLKKWEKSWNPDQFYSHPNFLSGQKVRLFYNDGVESGVLFMESLVLSLNVVLPLLFLILVGQGVRRLKLCDERALKQMNQLVFKLFLSCTLFNNILSTDLKTVLQPQLLIYAAVCVLAACAAGWLIMPRITSDPRKQGVMIMNTYRSNAVLFGMPIVQLIYGDSQLGVMSMLIAVIVPLFNILSVIVLESFRGGKARISKLIEGIATNPLIIASALGLLCLFSGVHLWKPVASVIGDMGKVSTPLALIILGAGFQPERVAENKKELLASVFARLVWTPLAALGIAVLLGIRGVALVSLLAIFASPNAVSSYSMAEGMGSDSELASQGLLLSTVFCIPTIFLWIFCFSQCGLI